MPTTAPFKIAVIAGDGIGKEVMPEGLRAAGRRPALWAAADITPSPGPAATTTPRTEKMMPDDWKPSSLAWTPFSSAAPSAGPLPCPTMSRCGARCSSSAASSTSTSTCAPVRLFDGVPCPLAGRKSGDIDYLVVRENTEGEYTSLGGIMYEGTEREIVIQESVYSRHGAHRLLKYAFDLAQSRPRKHVTLATKSNGIAISMPWWDQRADHIAQGYPDVTLDKQHIDILTARFVLQPGRFDVVAATNLFGDILSDLGPATTGTIGLAPSANLNPSACSPACSSPCTARRPTSTARTSPTPSPWSGRAR